jgi:hypothetical protein
MTLLGIALGPHTVLGDLWRTTVTLLALGILGGFWYLVVSNITPFPAAGKKMEGEPPSPNKYPRIQRVAVAWDVILFIWIVLEGAVLIPYLFIRYGLH